MVIDTYGQSFQTKSGETITIRLLTAQDAPFLVEIFENMSSESRYRRFHQSLENPKAAEVWARAEEIARMDEKSQGGLIAFKRPEGQVETAVAAARYVFVDEQTAEVAISVRDDSQGQGIGSQLLKLTAMMAQSHGLKRLVGDALNSNKAIWHVLDKLPFPYQRTPDGLISTIEIDLR